MKKELLDKPVICIYDIRAIQKYIFSNTVNIDIIGAGKMVLEILREALTSALKDESIGLQDDEYCMIELEDIQYVPYFHDERIKAQIITVGGGNAFMLYRTGRLCTAVNRLFSKYILEHSYSLQVAITAVEKTENINDDMNRLYLELDKVKNSDPFLHPLGALPIVRKESMSGNPVVSIDAKSGEEISRESQIKREKAINSAEVYDKKGFCDNLRKFNKKLAYIHMDGNSMGLTIGRIMNSQKNYEDGVIARRQLNSNIEMNFISTLADTEKWLQNLMRSEGIPEENFHCYYQWIHAGGDDVNVAVAYQYAYPFVNYFLQSVTKKCLWSDDKIGTINFSVCAGIAFVSADTSFKNGLRLAEECCEEAKTEAKKPENAVNGQIGNWFDFQIDDNRTIDSVTNARENSYVTQGNINLCLRPYCLDDERKDTPTHYGHLMQYLNVFHNQIKDEQVIKDLIAAYSGPVQDIERYLNNFENMGGQLTEYIGKPFVQVEGREQTCAAWYDALELIRYGL